MRTAFTEIFQCALLLIAPEAVMLNLFRCTADEVIADFEVDNGACVLCNISSGEKRLLLIIIFICFPANRTPIFKGRLAF